MNLKRFCVVLVIVALFTNRTALTLFFKNFTVSYGDFTSAEIVREIVDSIPAPAQFTSQTTVDTYHSLIMVGDVMLARNVEFLMNTSRITYPFEHIDFRSLAHKPYVIGNFEAAIPQVHSPTKTNMLQFSVTPESAAAAKQAGFSAFSLANNHALDFGQAGYEHTVKTLESLDLQSFGHPQNTSYPVLVQAVSGVRVAVIGFSVFPHEPSIAEIEAVLTYAHSVSDMQIVYIHWGEEYAPTHNLQQKSLAKQFVVHGADLIIGHHPHVVQDIQLIDGVPVLYSLGNFIFDQYFSPDVQEGLFVELTFGDTPVLRLIPVSSVSSLSQPRLLPAQKYQSFLDKLARKSDQKLADSIRHGTLELTVSVATSTKVAIINE